MRYSIVEEVPKNVTIALLDADIFAFRIAVNKKQTSEQISLYGSQEGRSLDDLIKEFYAYLRATLSGNDMNINKYIGFFSSNSFRKQVTAKYKANRTAFLLPDNLNELKRHLSATDTFYFVDGYEADDALAASQSENNNSIIFSTDKDLLQIPGYHYNLTKKQIQYVSKEDSEYNLWYQMLIGDKVDNIKYLKGLGAVSASNMLGNTDVGDYSSLVLTTFIKRLGLDKGVESFAESFKLIYLKRDMSLFKDMELGDILDLYGKSIRNEGEEDEGEYFNHGHS